jgi:hypothetical protein
MAPNTPVVVQFGGLLVALGLFGIGPAATFIDELRTLPTKKKKKKEKESDDQPQTSHHYLEPSTAEPNLRRKYTQDHPELVLVPALGTISSITMPPGLPPVKPNRADNNHQIHPPISWLSFLGTPPKSSE